jgi:LmbE family N-acetylglucosaminyl deacetylase
MQDKSASMAASGPGLNLSALAGRPVASVMVIAAHPDDEIVGAGAHLALWPGVRLVHVTNGSPRDPRYAQWAGFADRLSYAKARRREAIAASALAGIGEEAVIALDFDDQDGSRSLAPISLAIRDLIAASGPDAVMTHPYEGGHPDHDAVSFSVHHALKLLSREGSPVPAHLEMTSYFGRNGDRVVSQFLEDEKHTVRIALGEAQRSLKERMYKCFASQISLLAQFPLEVECFRQAPAYDFLRPPCAPPLFYDGFQLGTSSGDWPGLAAQAMQKLGF